MSSSEIQKIGLLLFPGFPMACLTSLIEPLRAANEVAGQTAFEWVILSETGAEVESSAGITFGPDIPLQDAGQLDQLFLLSSPSGRFENATHGEGLLRKFERHGITVGAISGGVFPLARAGLLAGKSVSVHWCYAVAFGSEFPRLHSTESLISRDGRCVTASGAAAAFELALHMIGDQLGEAIATEVACWFQHPIVRGEGIQQRRPAFKSPSTDDMLPELVQEAVAIFSDRIGDPIKIADVADALDVTVRRMERIFKKATGKSPLRYYRGMRMTAARQLVLYTNDTLGQIAHAVGYFSATTLAQNYEHVFGVHPNADREKINMFRVRQNAPLPGA